MAKLYYNIFAVVGTSEVELAPYPDGSATVPHDRYRKIHLVAISNNNTASPNSVAIRVYRGTQLEVELTFTVQAGSTVSICGTSNVPVLVVPPERTLRAVASSPTATVIMVGVDE